MVEKDEMDDSLNLNYTDTTDKIYLIKDFIQNNLIGFKAMRDSDFLTAKKAYKKNLLISQRLEDEEIKSIEAQANYSIALYFNGKFLEAKRHLEEAYKLTVKISNNVKYSGLVIQ